MRVHSYNERAKPFASTKTADQVLKKANRQITSNAHHWDERFSRSGHYVGMDVRLANGRVAGAEGG